MYVIHCAHVGIDSIGVNNPLIKIKIITKKNMPNMVSQITSVLAKENVNIAHMNNRSRGAVAYTMIDVDQPVSEQTVEAISAIEGMIRVRVIKSAY